MPIQIRRSYTLYMYVPGKEFFFHEGDFSIPLDLCVYLVTAGHSQQSKYVNFNL